MLRYRWVSAIVGMLFCYEAPPTRFRFTFAFRDLFAIYQSAVHSMKSAALKACWFGLTIPSLQSAEFPPLKNHGIDALELPEVYRSPAASSSVCAIGESRYWIIRRSPVLISACTARSGPIDSSRPRAPLGWW